MAYTIKKGKGAGTGHMSKTSIKKRVNAATNGRGNNSAYTGGARAIDQNSDTAGAMREAWRENRNVQTYTRTKNGRLSDGNGAKNAKTWTQTNRDMDGNLVSQSGRKTMSTRSQRAYDVRKGFVMAYFF